MDPFKFCSLLRRRTRRPEGRWHMISTGLVPISPMRQRSEQLPVTHRRRYGIRSDPVSKVRTDRLYDTPLWARCLCPSSHAVGPDDRARRAGSLEHDPERGRCRCTAHRFLRRRMPHKLHRLVFDETPGCRESGQHTQPLLAAAAPHCASVRSFLPVPASPVESLDPLHQ